MVLGRTLIEPQIVGEGNETTNARHWDLAKTTMGTPPDDQLPWGGEPDTATLVLPNHGFDQRQRR